MPNFKIKRMDNFKFNHQELIDYYDELEQNYQHLKWAVSEVYTPSTTPIDKTVHSVDGFYNWAVQSDLKDPTKPCPAYRVGDTEEIVNENLSGNYDVPTEIIFGFAEKLINLFSQFDPTQTLVVVHPPGTRIGFHVDTGNYVKIHLPIKSNSQSLFEYNDKVFVMEPGYAYLTNVSIPHATINNGTTDRVHLIFRVSDKFISMLETQEFVV
jgi:hypothetical protein